MCDDRIGRWARLTSAVAAGRSLMSWTSRVFAALLCTLDFFRRPRVGRTSDESAKSQSVVLVGNPYEASMATGDGWLESCPLLVEGVGNRAWAKSWALGLTEGLVSGGRSATGSGERVTRRSVHGIEGWTRASGVVLSAKSEEKDRRWLLRSAGEWWSRSVGEFDVSRDMTKPPLCSDSLVGWSWEIQASSRTGLPPKVDGERPDATEGSIWTVWMFIEYLRGVKCGKL